MFGLLVLRCRFNFQLLLDDFMIWEHGFLLEFFLKKWVFFADLHSNLASEIGN